MDLQSQIPKYDPLRKALEDVGETHTAVRPEPIAPWLHTVFLLIVLVLWASYSAFRTSLSVSVMPHWMTYASSIIIQCLLVGTTIAGLYQRRRFLTSVLGFTTRRGLLPDLGVGIATFIGTAMLLALLVYVLRLTALPITRRQDVVSAMAPRSLQEVGLWVLVSITAGICEEFVFRGYLQRQLTRWFKAAPLAIGICSILFGCMHFYQGPAGVIQITALGAIYGFVVVRRGNLRSVMVAHALQDVISGVGLYLLRNSHFSLP